MKPLALLFITALFLTSCDKEPVCVEKKCDDFRTRQEAQAAYDADPECYANLNADGDSDVCTGLPTF